MLIPLYDYTERLKLGMTTEIRSWCVAYGKAVSTKYSGVMKEVFEFVEDCSKKLSRPIKDLDDIRNAISVLIEIRQKEVDIDMNIGPVEVRQFHSSMQHGNSECFIGIYFKTQEAVWLNSLYQNKTLINIMTD